MGNSNDKKGFGYELRGTITTLFGAACWGLSGCFGQYLFTRKHIEVLWLIPWRLFSAGIVLTLIGFLISGRKNLEVWKHPKDVAHMFFFAFFGVVMSQTSYFMAINYSNAATATVLQSLAPVLILILVCIGKKRLPKIIETVSIIMAVLGVFLLGTHGNIKELALTPLGLRWGLLTAVAAMFYTTISGSLIRRYGVCQILGYSMFFTSIPLLFIIKPWNIETVLDFETVSGLAVIILVGSVIAYGLYLKGVSMVGPLKGSLYGNMEPVSAIIISVVWLGTKFETMDVIGFVLILVSASLLTLKKE